MATTQWARVGRAARDRSPWWLVIILGLLGWMAWLIITEDRYTEAYHRIRPGLTITIRTTLYGFVLASAIGLIAALGRMSKNTVLRNLARAYIEFIRGIPVIVLIFGVSFYVIPQFNDWLGRDNNQSFEFRGVVALAIVYGAFLAEVFRAGIESVPVGQIEAGRSLGLRRTQTLRRIVLPQAIRNTLPAFGNDFIAMLKDTALLSVVAVRELFQSGRVYAGSTFHYREMFFVVTFFYLSLTLALSLLVTGVERWLHRDD
jgi:polar amino acid transport system permease protein